MTRQAFTPREYQNDIKDHIVEHRRSGIFAGMGLGKTASILTTLDEMFLTGEETKPALICAPKLVAQSTWPDEAAKWDHLSGMDVVPILGTEKERLAALRLVGGSPGVFTINYENIPWLVETLDGRDPFGFIVADESTCLKGFRSNGQGTWRANCLARIAGIERRRWASLTGTPCPQGLQDLWGPSYFLDGGERLARSYEQFKDRWFTNAGQYNQLEARPCAQREIEERLRDICLSIAAEDYFDLKEPIRNYIYVTLPKKARDLYNDMERQLFMEVEGHGIEALNSAAKSQKLLQLCSGAVYLDRDVYDDEQPKAKEWKEVHDVKLQALESVVNEANGMPVLCSYHFRSDVARIRRDFGRARPLDDKPGTIRDWNAGKIPLMPAHPKSAGHGLNLQDGGNIICHFSHWWDNERFQQINARIGPVRQMQSGHNRCVFEHYIVCKDTIEEEVIARRWNHCTVEESFRQAMKRRVA